MNRWGRLKIYALDSVKRLIVEQIFEMQVDKLLINGDLKVSETCCGTPQNDRQPIDFKS